MSCDTNNGALQDDRSAKNALADGSRQLFPPEPIRYLGRQPGARTNRLLFPGEIRSSPGYDFLSERRLGS
jgi:hypothetical protein